MNFLPKPSLSFALAIAVFTLPIVAKAHPKHDGVYKNIYSGCISTQIPESFQDKMASYCSCIAEGVTTSFTHDEIATLEQDIRSVEDSASALKIVGTNEKMRKLVGECAANAFG